MCRPGEDTGYNGCSIGLSDDRSVGEDSVLGHDDDTVTNDVILLFNHLDDFGVRTDDDVLSDAGVFVNDRALDSAAGANAYVGYALLLAGGAAGCLRG